MSVLLRSALVGLCISGLPGIVHAEVAPTIVVFDAEAEDSEAAVRSAWLQQEGALPGLRFVPVDAVFPASSDVVLLGDAEVQRCAGEPTSPADLTALNRKALDLFAQMEYLSASTSLAEADRLIPCLNGAPRPMDLAAYHMLRGMVAFETDGPDEASARFEEGLLVSPFLQWDERFPPLVKPSFDAAVKSAISAEKAFLSVSEGILTEGALWLDGLAVDPRTRTTTVYEGTHLVQWKEQDGAVASWVVRAGAGDSVILIHRQDAVLALLTGRADPILSAYARDMVLAPVDRGPQSGLIAAQRADVVLFHRFDVAAGAWVLADVHAIEDFRAAGLRMRNAGIATSVGGALMAVLGVVTVGLGVRGMEDVRSEIRYGYDPEDFDETDPEEAAILAEGPLARFNNNKVTYDDHWSEVQLGITIGAVGGLLAIGGVPLIIEGSGRSRAMGLNRKARRAARRVAQTAEAEAEAATEGPVAE